jgi:uncharacterized protein
MNLNRRDFLKSSAVSAAALAAPTALTGLAQPGKRAAKDKGDGRAFQLVDTNVHLFEWPFRDLRYAKTPALVQKLRKHGVTEAWAGSFHSIFYKDFKVVNERLVAECKQHGDGLLVPVGSVNPMWPDWQEDLRVCHEVYKMRAIRLHPCFQNYTLEEPAFAKLLAKATERKLLVQIVVEMEDPRVHHPALHAPSVNPIPLGPLLQKIPGARIQLLGDALTWTRLAGAQPLIKASNVVHDISSIEGVGMVGRLIGSGDGSADAKFAVERFAFGSHAPYYPVENALLKLFETTFTDPQLHAIMSGNSRRLLGAT